MGSKNIDIIIFVNLLVVMVAIAILTYKCKHLRELKGVEGEAQSKKVNRKLRLIILSPYLVIIIGALFTRYSEELLYSFIITIISSIALFISLTLALTEEKVKSKDLGLLAGMIFYSIIRFSTSYFLILIFVYGFNIKKIIELL